MIRIGEKLAQERKSRGLTIEDVAKATKIKASFLLALEKGDYKKLPSGIYAQGFISNYAQYLGVSKREALALFRREYYDDKPLSVLPESLSKNQRGVPFTFRFSQSLVAIMFIMAAVLLYLLFQFRSIFIDPSLVITHPKEGFVTSASSVTVQGKTDGDSVVYINGQSTTVDQSGRFQKKIEIFAGTAIITVKAVNRFGREKLQKVTVEYRPSP